MRDTYSHADPALQKEATPLVGLVFAARVSCGKAHRKDWGRGPVPAMASACSIRTRRNICAWAIRVGGTPNSWTGQPAADS